MDATSSRALVSLSTGQEALPALFAGAGERAARRVLDFFTVSIRNRHTRAAYGRALGDFCSWCDRTGLSELGALRPDHIAAYIETLTHRVAAPTVKQHLAALRSLFDWLV